MADEIEFWDEECIAYRVSKRPRKATNWQGTVSVRVAGRVLINGIPYDWDEHFEVQITRAKTTEPRRITP